MPIHSHAVEIVQKLVRAGHQAFFAGGWVRDYLMNHPSDDIDIATSASPEEILDLFPNTILVGIQFGVIIVSIEGHQYEVATFRKDIDYQNGRKPEKIERASAEEDALRRDFTINGMFFDPIDEKLYDYVGGKKDLEMGVIRAIGNPDERFFEDRLRMIRAIRFAARFNFHIDLETQSAITSNAETLFPAVAMERIWQEFSKMSAYPHFDRALIELHRFNLLQTIFPDLKWRKLKDLELHVLPISRYPLGTPTAFFLLELFPEASEEELLGLGKYLKAPNKDFEILGFYLRHAPFSLSQKDSHLTRFYAHPFHENCLQVYASRLPDAEQFLSDHRTNKERLKDHINRIVAKRPVISSQFLMLHGVRPGIQMGSLLKKAEELSIDLNIGDPKALYAKLMEQQ